MSATHAELIPFAWAAVVAAGKAMSTDSGSYQWGEDDDGMQSADAESLLDWVDDCEARLGADVANFRVSVLDFIAISTDGAGLDAADLESAVQNVKAFASRGGARMSANTLRKMDAEQHAKANGGASMAVDRLMKAAAKFRDADYAVQLSLMGKDGHMALVTAKALAGAELDEAIEALAMVSGDVLIAREAAYRNALEHIAGSCEGRAAEVASSALKDAEAAHG